MAALMDTRILIRKIQDLRALTPRRNRVKTKWAGSLPKYPPTNLALQHFDATYKLQLGREWPSVRASMLCEQKYGALVNNFATTEGFMAHLQSQGCQDFVSCTVREGAQERLQTAASTHGNTSSLESVVDDQDIVPSGLSPNIKCLVFPRGDISRFKPSRPDKYGLLGYYLMDAASILPALALDVQEGHTVLDLCAAPGGKALALLQTQAIRFLCVNDISASRTLRLRRVLDRYVPKGLLAGDKLRITSFDGRKWGEIERDTFDRVLVDVPCTTDRHSVMEEENNIFNRARTKERQRLPQLQLELLLAGIQAACPGGVVLYSTCSLSQLQNWYVVDRAIHLAREELGISLQVADLRPLTQLFKDTFNFAPDLNLGQLVLPHLTANFGPIYMCKLQRLN
ncbi:5-methylcytosine rRNA methyltransferase NSUN4 [Esox lucius]|uniref:5-cytosine rRNA methyltransferase NSUN4 n=1 Tax=Esox lucius TaxID=8010 RepID=A0A3P8YVG0_ESOLU|nr:5-methylcytosine rRNA methyltransferase NSUN4 [Esox lucius]